jgi:hypothetical protein
VKAQRERALHNTVGRGRAATPSMSHAGLIDLTESTMGLSRVRESPSDYRSWRGWTSGQSGDAVLQRQDMRRRAKVCVTHTHTYAERERREREAEIRRGGEGDRSDFGR